MIIERTRRTASFVAFCLLVFFAGGIWLNSGDPLKAAIGSLLAAVIGYLFVWGFMMIGRGGDEEIHADIIRSLSPEVEAKAKADEPAVALPEEAAPEEPRSESLPPLITDAEDAALNAVYPPDEATAAVEESEPVAAAEEEVIDAV